MSMGTGTDTNGKQQLATRLGRHPAHAGPPFKTKREHPEGKRGTMGAIIYREGH